MPLPDITININPAQAVAPTPLRDEVVGIVGPVGASGSGAAGTLVDGSALADFIPGQVDAASVTGEAVSQLLNQVTVDTVWSPTVASPTVAQIATAIDLLATHSPPVSLVMLVGNMGAQAANLTKLQTFCADTTRLARGVVAAVQTGNTLAARSAAAVTGASGLGDRIMMVFGKPAAATSWSTGAWLGSALRTASQRGRQWGIQMIPVTGAGTLQDMMSLGTAQLVDLDNAGISSLIIAEGATRIAGGFFNYAAGNPLRDWSVARVVDHVEHILRRTWLTRLVGSTSSLPAMAAVMQSSLDQLIGNEITAVGVVGTGAMGASRTFDVSLSVPTPAGNIVINITLVT